MIKRLLFPAVLLCVMSVAAASNDTIRVAYRAETAANSAMGPISAYAKEVITLIADRCGWKLEHVYGREADILATAFRSREIDRNYDFVRAPLGNLGVALFARAESAASLRETLPSRWPRQRLAWSPGALNAVVDFRNWNLRALAPVEEVEYPDYVSAIDAVRRDACQLFLRATTQTPEGFERISDIGTHPYFFAVRHGNRDIFNRLTEEYERIRIYEPDLLDRLREKHFGIKPPEHRVRVGRYFEPGLSDMQEDGDVTGGNNDYIDRIAEYSGWNVEWVTGDYNRLLLYLSEGRIDVLPGVTATKDRIEKYLFPHLSAGLYRSYLFAKYSSPYEEGRFQGWKGAVIGTGPGEQANVVMAEYLKENGVRCEVREYSSAIDAVLGFFRGECQILHATGLHTLGAEKVLHAFPAVPSYVIAAPQRPDLLADIEESISRINSETPGFDDEVNRRHFITRRANSFYLSERERTYLRNRITDGRPVKVEISPVAVPLKSWNFDRAEATGFVRALFDELSRRTGLKFLFLPPADGETARRRYENGDMDIWADYNADISGLPVRYDAVESITFPRVIICRRSVKLEDPTAGRIAMTRWERERVDAEHGRALSGVMLFDSLDECVRAVRNGIADCTMCPVGRGAQVLREIDSDDRLEMRPAGVRLRRMSFPISFSPKCDPELATIITSALATFDQGDIEACMAGTITEFVHERMPVSVKVAVVIMSLLGGGLLLIGVIVFARARRVRDDIELRERTVTSHDMLISREVNMLMTSSEIISTRAEFIRSPTATREQTLGWTAEILRQAENMIIRFNNFKREMKNRQEESAKLRRIHRGGAE